MSVDVATIPHSQLDPGNPLARDYLVSPDKVLFGQWSMVRLVLSYLLAAGVWCSWRNPPAP